jgi:hypothetical protein
MEEIRVTWLYLLGFDVFQQEAICGHGMPAHNRFPPVKARLSAVERPNARSNAVPIKS